MLTSKIHRATVTQADLHHVGSAHPGDLVAEARTRTPRVVFVDERNRVVATGSDAAQALPGSGLVRGDVLVPTG